jgi:hypothetical protein
MSREERDARRQARGTYEGTAREVNRTDGNRERRRNTIRGEVDLNFDPGDEKAQVAVTRGFKSWFSTRDAGLTVEAGVTVTVRCGQSEKELATAIDECSKFTTKKAEEGIEEMGLFLDSFQKDQNGSRR